MTVNLQCNAQLGYVESHMTNSLLPITGKFNGRQQHLSAQSTKLNFTIVSVQGFSKTNLVINVPGNG